MTVSRRNRRHCRRRRHNKSVVKVLPANQLPMLSAPPAPFHIAVAFQLKRCRFAFITHKDKGGGLLKKKEQKQKKKKELCQSVRKIKTNRSKQADVGGIFGA